MSGKAVRETLGFLAVVASMVFVGLEIQQNNTLAQAAAYQASGIATAAAIDNMAHDRQLLLSTHGKEPAAIPPGAMERFGYSGWEGMFEEPTEACVWPLIRPGVSASFRQFVEEGRDLNAIDCSEFAIPPTLF